MTDKYSVVYGFDPGLRHGSIISLTGPKPYMYNLEAFWTKSVGGGMAAKADPHEIAEFAQNFAFNMLKGLAPGPIFIEYDKNSVYWRAQKIQVVTLGMFLGYFSSMAHMLGLPVVFLRNRDIRSVYGFTKGSKEKFQQHFLDNCLEDFNENVQQDMVDLKGSDTLDSIITAAVYYYADKEERDKWEYQNA